MATLTRKQARIDGWKFDLLRSDLRGKGWIAQDLADRSGLSKATVSRVLRGLRANPRTMSDVAKALGHSVRRYIVPSSGTVSAS